MTETVNEEALVASDYAVHFYDIKMWLGLSAFIFECD